jgi:polysaccharide biosynthesis/export protein
VRIVRICGIVLLGAMVGPAAETPPVSLREGVEQLQPLNTPELRSEQVRDSIGKQEPNVRVSNDEAKSIMRAQTAPGTLTPDYRIGPGDVLQISVWREPDASVGAITVRGDGKVSLPLVKEVEVAGLTPTEAESMLAEKLSRYVHGADVTVIVREVNSRKIYLIGGVRRVGVIDLKSQMTILQAITQAGGLSDFAKRKNIYVLRSENGKQVRIPFNYDAFIRGGKTDQNLLLMPNDTIVVPQ